jgi:hypothetical protein
MLCRRPPAAAIEEIVETATTVVVGEIVETVAVTTSAGLGFLEDLLRS